MNEESLFIEDNFLIVISRQTWNIFKKEKNPEDLLCLYVFYYDCARFQKTNQPWATVAFVCKGLKWGRHRVLRNKKKLEELGFIRDIKRVDRKTGKIVKWFIKMNFIWRESTLKNHSLISDTVDSPQSDFRHSGQESNKSFNDKQNNASTVSDSGTVDQCARFPHCGHQPTNALSATNTNALSDYDILDSSPKGLDSSHVLVPKDEPLVTQPPLRGAAKNAVAAEGSQLGSSALLLNKVIIGDSEHLTSIEKKEKQKKTEKQKEKEQIERLEKEYFLPEDQRKDPECKFDYERYFKDLTDQYYDGKWKRGIIIGNYFVFKGMKFMSAKAAYLEFKRNLKPATAIIEYKWDDIDSAFEYLRESKFGKSFSWTLETVAKYVVMPEIVDGSWKRREKGGVYF